MAGIPLVLYTSPIPTFVSQLYKMKFICVPESFWPVLILFMLKLSVNVKFLDNRAVCEGRLIGYVGLHLPRGLMRGALGLRIVNF